MQPALCPRVTGEFTLASGEALMARLLTRNPRPTAVLAANDEIVVSDTCNHAIRVVTPGGAARDTRTLISQ
jgi:ABC-type sugar transport system substrate-binding protein